MNDFLVATLKKKGKVPELFDPDGSVAAQMIVHAVERADGDDLNKRIAGSRIGISERPRARR